VFTCFADGFANATSGFVDSVRVTEMASNSEPIDFSGRQLATNELVTSYELSEFERNGTALAAFLDGSADQGALLENITHSIRATILADLGFEMELVATGIGRGASPPLERVRFANATSAPLEPNMMPFLVGGSAGGAVVALLLLRLATRKKKPAKAEPLEVDDVILEEAFALPASAAFPPSPQQPRPPTVGSTGIWTLCASESPGAQDWPLMAKLFPLCCATDTSAPDVPLYPTLPPDNLPRLASPHPTLCASPAQPRRLSTSSAGSRKGLISP
jgi:hypothetical protein